MLVWPYLMDRYHHTPCVDVCRERGEGVRGETVWEKRKGVLRRGVGGEAVWGWGVCGDECYSPQ